MAIEFDSALKVGKIVEPSHELNLAQLKPPSAELGSRERFAASISPGNETLNSSTVKRVTPGLENHPPGLQLAVPSGREIATGPLSNLNVRVNQEFTKLMGYVEANKSQIPPFQLHGAPKEGMAGLLNDRKPKDGVIWVAETIHQAENVRHFTQDIINCSRTASRYSANPNNLQTEGGVFVFNADRLDGAVRLRPLLDNNHSLAKDSGKGVFSQRASKAFTDNDFAEKFRGHIPLAESPFSIQEFMKVLGEVNPAAGPRTQLFETARALYLTAMVLSFLDGQFAPGTFRPVDVQEKRMTEMKINPNETSFTYGDGTTIKLGTDGVVRE